jgi:Mn2+/Fe2+ NRAMP family transporter
MVAALVDLILGIVTSIGGFVEVGSISTSAQGGAEFGFQLLWAIAIAGAMLALLSEMSGRLAVMSKRSIAAAVRERFGIHFHFVPVGAELILDVLLLTAELGGAAIGIKLLTGVGFQWWIMPIALAVWMILWFSNFTVVEYGIGLLGLVTLSFVLAAWRLGPDPGDLARGFLPSLPSHDAVRYAFLGISIVGATVSPYLLNFYSSGTIEEDVTQDELWVNTATSYAGIMFGTVVSMGVLVTSAMVIQPLHIKVDSYEQAALMFVPAFGRWAVALFALSLAIGCIGAALEISLNMAYLLSQVFGWSWSINKSRADNARFSSAFTCILVIATAIALLGFDPLRLTMISVALTVVVMPLMVLPFLVLMNDTKFVRDRTNSPIGNAILACLTVLGAILALVVIPLEILGG